MPREQMTAREMKSAHPGPGGRPAGGRVPRAGVQRVVMQQQMAVWAHVKFYVAVKERLHPGVELAVFGCGERPTALERVGKVSLAVVPRADPALLGVRQAGELRQYAVGRSGIEPSGIRQDRHATSLDGRCLAPDA